MRVTSPPSGRRSRPRRFGPRLRSARRTDMADYDRYFCRGSRAMRESAIRRAGDVRAPDLISFAPGFPDPALFAWDEFRDIAEGLLDGSDPGVLQYGPTRGYRGLIELLPDILAERGIAATVDN